MSVSNKSFSPAAGCTTVSASKTAKIAKCSEYSSGSWRVIHPGSEKEKLGDSEGLSLVSLSRLCLNSNRRRLVAAFPWRCHGLGKGKPLQSFQVRQRKTAALHPPWYFSCMFINGCSSSPPIKSNLLKRFGMLIYNLLLSGRRSIYCYGDGTSRSVADVELFMWLANLCWILPAWTWGVVIQTGPGCVSAPVRAVNGWKNKRSIEASARG